MQSMTRLPARTLAGRLAVTPLGLGMAALGRPGYINLGHGEDYRAGRSLEAMKGRAFAVLDAAWEAGVRYFDAARSYGRGEAFLGAWLQAREIPVATVTVASKWGYTYTADWRVEATHHEIKDHSLAVLRRQWQETQDQLGGYLALYQIHSATFESGVLEDRAVHEELARYKAAGTLIGLTLSGPRQAQVLERARVLLVDGVRLFDAVQATWNLLEPSAGPALQGAHAEGMGVVVKETLANGRLTCRNRDPGFDGPRQVLQNQAARLGVGVDAFALAAVLARPWADVVLSGAATSEQLRSNLRSLEAAWDDEAQAAASRLAERPEDYWRTRANLAWN